MASFLSSPAQFRLLGFSSVTEEYVDPHRGIVTVHPPDSKEPLDPVLAKLDSIPRFLPPLPLPHQAKVTRSIWGSTPVVTPQLEPATLMSPFVDSEEYVSKALYEFLALNHQRIYHQAREITRAQAQLSSGIKRLEATATATNTKATQFQKDLRIKKDRLTTCMALMHQEVSKTRFHLQATFSSLRRTRESIDLLLLREGLTEKENLTMDAQSYPNLYQLTYRHRFARPRSYHPQLQHQQCDSEDIKPRCSLDLPHTGRSWSISRAGALRHLSGVSSPHRERGSVTSLPEATERDPSGIDSNNSSASSLISSAISKVQFANSKAYRQLSPSEASPPTSNAEEHSKRKSFSLRSTISLASLRTLRKIIPPQNTPTNTVRAKPLNAKDRLHQIAAASPGASQSHSSHFSKWFPNMFRGTEPPLPSSKTNSVSRSSKKSKPPTLPDLEAIDYRDRFNNDYK
ncbi:hypothetical protein DSO57_1009538 [Entomophthora muscae]|uniref:Uncharacterized protein n=2 Tax=Entomophthora muscae TaxID=34485 RepID=A0ACC2RLG9_9FUNG|nr:hypothetical protein DSO57_1009538 [Entomophthora muscae]